jgi:hypothetical protein
MIHIVEFPPDGKPHAWFAFDCCDFARKVYAGDALPDWQIFDVLSPGELLAMMELAPDSPEVAARAPAILALAEKHGWETPLYRADYLLGRATLQPQAISEAEACAAALRHRTPLCRIYWTDGEAGDGLERDALLNSGDGYRGREALRAQLIALEVLEGL